MLSNAGLDILSFHVSLNCFFLNQNAKKEKESFRTRERKASLPIARVNIPARPSRSLMLLPAAVTIAWTENYRTECLPLSIC